jgi:DNA-binding NarL/FixJ family response regulator
MTIISSMETANVTRVVLADYAGLSRAALVTLLAAVPDTELVAHVDDPELLEPVVHRERPDVVVVDDRLLRERRWTADELEARLIVVGMDDDPGFVERARQLGAEAWIAKERADALLPLLLTRPAPVIRQD